jgi:hypothetical protein
VVPADAAMPTLKNAQNCRPQLHPSLLIRRVSGLLWWTDYNEMAPYCTFLSSDTTFLFCDSFGVHFLIDFHEMYRLISCFYVLCVFVLSDIIFSTTRILITSLLGLELARKAFHCTCARDIKNLKPSLQLLHRNLLK